MGDFCKDGSIINCFSSERSRETQNLEKMYLGEIINGVSKYERTIT